MHTVVTAAKGEGISHPKRENLKTTQTNFHLEIVKSDKVKLAKTAATSSIRVTFFPCMEKIMEMDLKRNKSVKKTSERCL